MEKLVLLTVACLAFLVVTGKAQTSEVRDIEKVVSAFAKAGDENDAEKLATYLDDNYRVVMNRLFGSSEVSILPRSIYLEKIKSKEFGGDERDVTVEDVVINGETASAKVTMKGIKATFVSLMVLIKDAEGDWKLVSDTPTII
ncbi:MAG: nuclear transport factor 2 family protein [Tunicatimonas sp.]|uniref:nuclear transport factor 2 family protein n=1 Tax=Tunicatimonas sp. TaxID=1940096 RepID=UPI003C75C90A